MGYKFWFILFVNWNFKTSMLWPDLKHHKSVTCCHWIFLRVQLVYWMTSCNMELDPWQKETLSLWREIEEFLFCECSFTVEELVYHCVLSLGRYGTFRNFVGGKKLPEMFLQRIIDEINEISVISISFHARCQLWLTRVFCYSGE